MKHLFKKIFVRGAGGGKPPKPKPAVLEPPQEIKFSLLQSFSIAEIIDLLSDGPIEGLVNNKGLAVNDNQILQGIYLDNTPIAEEGVDDSAAVLDSYDTSSLLNPLGKHYYNNGQALTHKYIKYSYERSIFFQYSSELTTRFGTSTSSSYYSGLTKKKKGAGGTSLWGVQTWGSSDDSYYLATETINNVPTPISIKNSRLQIHALRSTHAAATTDVSTKDYNFLPRLKSYFNTYAASPLTSNWEKLRIASLQLKLASILSQTNILSQDYITVVLSMGLKSSISTYGNSDPIYMSKLNGTKAYQEGSATPVEISFRFKNISPSLNNLAEFLLVPEVNLEPTGGTSFDNVTFTGNVYGCVVLRIPTPKTKRRVDDGVYEYTWTLPNSIASLEKSSVLLQAINTSVLGGLKPSKYNFSNIRAEIRTGEESQELTSIIKNTYIDYETQTELFGPFKLSSKAPDSNYSVQRITKGYNKDAEDFSNPQLNLRVLSNESSRDDRDTSSNNVDFAKWNSINPLDEEAKPVTHIFENPHTSSFAFSLGVINLSDTLVQLVGKGESGTELDLKAGSKVPTIVQFKVEWGKIKDGQFSTYNSRTFALLAQIEGQTIIDFGNGEAPNQKLINAIRDPYSFGAIDFTTPFELPSLLPNENPSTCKRFMKITKLSAETNSVLVNKQISLHKVTEIIPHRLSYPFSSIVAMTIDARSFSTIPERTYDCRLKKIQIPTNYFPLGDDGKDLRYLNHTEASTYQKTNKIYNGDWDGSFKEGWTDNPAWIIYDLLTNSRYGLGQYIDESQINIWQLYKIGRFCDAVDDNGCFQGAPDGNGGLEPRFSCNILFKENTKIFDAINVITNIFRGSAFFANSEVNFLDDRPRTPIALFTNSNVKDGLFSYSNYRKDEQFNTVEVSFLDRFDNFQSKIEYVEDTEDVRKRGPLKKMVAAEGVTSRAMARRAGQHLLYQTLKENQGVEFVAGTEILLCAPGDLIIIEDDLKTRSTNYGRVLAVDKPNQTLTIEELFDSGNYTGRITTFVPTGMATNAELHALASVNRSRVDQFYLTGNAAPSNNNITGKYGFSGYVTGFPVNTSGLPVQFPLYTGTTNGTTISRWCWYSTAITGFMFANNIAGINNPSSNTNYMITSTGLFNIGDVVASSESGTSILNTGYLWQASAPYRGAGAAINYLFSGMGTTSNGLQEFEIDAFNNPQITTFNITGFDNDTGNNTSLLKLDKTNWNTGLLNVVKAGYPYRLVRKNASDSIYKIMTVRENNQNEYTVVASRYDTGKFATIENFAPSEWLPSTYYTGPSVISNIDTAQLASPVITQFTTGTVLSTSFPLTGSWNHASPATGYSWKISNVLSNQTFTGITGTNANLSLTGLTVMGKWTLAVKALAPSKINDSLESTTGAFIAYSSLATLSKAVISNFTIK